MDLQLLGGQGWQSVERFLLQPREMRKLRVPSSVLAQSQTSSERTALLRAVYSVSVSEVVANAWLEDETTGFSNTVLFHEVRPQSSTLYGAQFVVKGFPRDLLPDSPDFEAYLVLANVHQLPQDATPTLYCDIAGVLVQRKLAPIPIDAEQTVSLSLNKLLADQFGHAGEAICSAEIVFTGTPGTLFGRYFAESSTLTYGLYAKLESGLGHAFNELYWNVDGDKTPLLTVTNFSDTMERIDIWATRDRGSKILRTVELPAKASVHLNMRREFAERSADFSTLQSAGYGGLHIRAENPTAKLLVKEHIFSLSKQVASPYYGSPDIIISHHIQSYPPQMVVGQNATAQTMTCYYSGCSWNGWLISSFHPTIVSTQWPPGWLPTPITAHQPGSATLYSSAEGPINQYGDQGWKDADALIVVFDATPVIGAIVPNTIPAGGSQIAEIYGTNFGTNPTVSATGGITVTHLYKSPTQINVQFNAPATPPGTYSVSVTSAGFSGSGFQQAPGGGSQAQSPSKPASVACPLPTEENTQSAGWADSSGLNAVHNFTQELQPLPTSQPTGVSFSGRRVKEFNSSPATDGCHFDGSIWPKVIGVSGGEWTVGTSNRWGFDSVGPINDFFFYYQQQRPSRGLPLPCSINIFQQMRIQACGGGTSYHSCPN